MRSTLAVMIMLFSLAGPASAEAPLWKDVGAWQIRVDTSLGRGCFALSTYESGTVFRIGFDIDSKQAYILVGNDGWRSIEPGQEYPLTFRFDRESPWEGEATGYGFRETGTRFLMAHISDPEFFSEFARKHRISISYRRREIARLSLRGSNRAFEEMLSCQRAMSRAGAEASRSNPDPFAGGSHEPAADPFR